MFSLEAQIMAFDQARHDFGVSFEPVNYPGLWLDYCSKAETLLDELARERLLDYHEPKEQVDEIIDDE